MKKSKIDYLQKVRAGLSEQWNKGYHMDSRLANFKPTIRNNEKKTFTK